ncbi:enoyl-CoA hydratase/isomerase family protein [Cupriavidus metallidurans]|uniref:enoyl-CoA hydratase/isomerase family protein n=1 Tax=Cupriavidus metallidurans TaxID=119219 RepID=UPI001648B600|nr:enoyl-CoA hydratase-related protein [Cupriavidus metallidurans]
MFDAVSNANSAGAEGLLVNNPRPGVALVTINRPERMNAIDPQLNAALEQVLQGLGANADIQCIVITGAGDRAFCAGAHIPTMLPHLAETLSEGTDDPQFAGVTHRAPSGKPLIAAINGVALGGGLELALACDIRIASVTARFGLPEISVGILAGAGGCTRLPRSISPALAAEMILTGTPIDADRAFKCGLISQVLPACELLNAALDLAATIASRAPRAVRACTELLRRQSRRDLAPALAEEREVFASVMATQDAREGIEAFTQKRAPRFQDA